MRNRRNARTGTVLLAAALSFALSCAAAVKLDRLNDGRARDEMMYFPSGLLLKEFSFGHATLLSDLIWLRGIQYYGEHKLSDRDFRYLSHIFDTMTSMDPKFSAGYVFGSLVISQEAGEVAQAIRLLEKGVRANPGNWEILFETGFTYYVFLKDYRKSAEYFRLAAARPGCPEYVTRFAAFSSSRAGEKEFAVRLWTELMRNTKNPHMREIAEKNIARLAGRGV